MNRFYTILIATTLLGLSNLSAQVFPYIEAYDTITVIGTAPLNGRAGYIASSNVYVAQARGINSSNCVQAQMKFHVADSLISPLVGPTTTSTQASLYYRIVQGSSILSPYTLTGTDRIEILVGLQSFNLYSAPQYTINASNQNTTGTYSRLSFPVTLAGQSGNFKIRISNPSNSDWIFHIDSIVIRDTAVVNVVHITTDSLHNVNCHGQSTGSIHISASGGSTPYQYHWGTGVAGDTLASLSGKPAGIYLVTVTDATNASATAADTIREPAQSLTIDALHQLNVKCFGDQTGCDTVIVNGGTPTYIYTWAGFPFAGSNIICNLVAGGYSVTVTDSKACTASSAFTITQPLSALSASVTSASSTGTTGTATVIPNGGTNPYSFNWNSSPAQGNAIATGLAPGLYKVTVTDHNNCTIVDSVFVANSSVGGIADIATSALVVFPNPVRDEVYFELPNKNYSKIEASMMDMLGNVVLSEELNSNHLSIVTLNSGIYILKLRVADKYLINRIVVNK